MTVKARIGKWRRNRGKQKNMVRYILNNWGRNLSGFSNPTGLGSVYPYFLRRYLVRVNSFNKSQKKKILINKDLF